VYSVAVVEDEPLTRKAIALSLRDAGYAVHEASDALACRALLRQTRLDVIVLDLGLPGIDGMSFARELRSASEIGLIVVTRQSAPEARIAALDLGADDYLVKPVHYGELAARIRSVMRRSGRERGRRRRLGPWIVDLEARTVDTGTPSPAMRAATLTRGEFDILARLVQAGTKIVTRQELLSLISRAPQESDLRSVDALVSRLRRKLDGPSGDSLIVTAPGFGYRLATAPGEP
jgi:DNA-binding response OmpR family regulator